MRKVHIDPPAHAAGLGQVPMSAGHAAIPTTGFLRIKMSAQSGKLRRNLWNICYKLRGIAWTTSFTSPMVQFSNPILVQFACPNVPRGKTMLMKAIPLEPMGQVRTMGLMRSSASLWNILVAA
jgi:hypothetical protein